MVSGSLHDFRILKEKPFNRPLKAIIRLMKYIVIWADSAYIAIVQLYPHWECRVLQRAKRNHPLTREEKMNNQLKSKIRIAVEHTIARIKRFRCCQERTRKITPARHSRYWNIVAGICNMQRIEELKITSIYNYSQEYQTLRRE